jgi:ubiquinone/menaquinone biosynthesis C-methylase UbiE
MFYVEHMEEDERVAGLHVGEILDSLALQPGMRVADVGAGSGLFSFEIAKHVLPDGIVFAVDINGKLLEHIEAKAHENNAGNVRTVLAVEDDPRIPQTVDLIFICDTLHYIDGQPGYIKTLSRYVKPNGRIAVVDFKENWPPQSVRFSEEQIVRWMRDAGLESAGDYRFIKDEFFKIFKKVELQR